MSGQDELTAEDIRFFRADFRTMAHRGGKCRRGCCWNPFGVCGMSRACDCHHWVGEGELVTRITPRQKDTRPDVYITRTEDGPRQAA